MKKQNNLSPLRIGLTYSGSVLGVGYLSGQELWQFFSSFGRGGFFGFTVTFFAMSFLAILVMLIAKRTGFIEMDKIIVPWDIPFLCHTSAALEVFFLIATVIIMYAGGGALMNQLFSLPHYVGSLIVCVAVSLIAVLGLSGTMKFFSLMVPPTVVATILIGIISTMRFGVTIPTEPQNANPLLNNWLISALTFTAYNFFCIIGLLAPIGTMAKSQSDIKKGAFIGSSLLILMALSITLAMYSYPDSWEENLPIMAVCEALNPVFCYPYGIVLLCGMSGAALYSIVAVQTFFEAKSDGFSRHKGKFIFLCAVVCYPLSLFGFANLVSVVYPVTGYLSIIFIIFMIFHYRKISKN